MRESIALVLPRGFGAAGSEMLTINDLPLTDDQRSLVLEWFGRKLWNLLMSLGIQDGSCKSYDPLVVELDTHEAHSYVFDLEDGGRHHPFRDLAHLEAMLEAEALKQLTPLREE